MQRAEIDEVMRRAAIAFAERGYTGVSIRDLAQICQVSAPTLYHYFGSKEQFFDAVCAERYREALAAVRRAMDPDADLLTQMQTVAVCLFDLLVGDRVLFLLLRRDLIEGSLEGREPRSRRQYETLIDLITGVLQAAGFPEDEARRLAFTTSALVFGYCEFVHVAVNAGIESADITLPKRREDLIWALAQLVESKE